MVLRPKRSPRRAEQEKAGILEDHANVITDENEKARVGALRSALSLLALVAVLACLVTIRIPTEQPAAEPDAGG